MNSKTLEAIINQVNAMKAERYELGIYHRDSANMFIERSLTLNDIIKIIPKLKYKNMVGNDIYIRPDPIENRAIVLVDDITIKTIQSMKERGVDPACVVETSPNNYQVWISLGNETLAGKYRKEVASLLTKEFNADPACVASSHFGRLAGFTNQKKIYFVNNRFPFVLCHEYTGDHAKKYIHLIELAKKELDNLAFTKNKISLIKKYINIDSNSLFCDYFNSWLQNTMKYNSEIDYSRGDFAVACRMIKEGYSRDDIISAIVLNSPNIEIRKKNHVDDYATRTVDSAIKICHR
jgi:hypothetical protein